MNRYGPYELRGELARGAMGVVFRAHDPALDRPIALKVIRSEDLRDPESQQRFLRELRILARLRHPNVITVHSAGLSDHGYPYVAMDLIEGGSLRDRLERDGPLPLQEAVRICVQLAKALAYAHSRGVLHRDIKPHNILLDGDDALLTDFGLAKLVGADAQGLTRSGDRIGTPLYMAPEQAQGDNRRVGPATDVYSLGVTLFHMITGKRPFTAPSVVELFTSIIRDPAPSVRRLRPDVDDALEAIIARCLEKDPEDRFPAAAALRDALVVWQETGDSRASPLAQTARAKPSPSVTAQDPAASSRRKTVSVGLAIGLLFGLFLGLLNAAWLERAVRRDVWREELPEQLRVRAERGTERFLRDDFVGAIEDLDFVIGAEPNCSSAWYRRAGARRALKQPKEARVDLDRAIEIDPEFAEAYSVRAQVRQEEDAEGALADYNRAVSLEPLNPTFYRNRAALHYKEERTAEALKDVERSLELDPRFAQSYYLRGAIKERTDGEGAGLPDWELATTYEPGEAEILNARGLLRNTLGDAEGAIADYTAAIAALVEKPIYHHNRGATFEARSEWLAALADLSAALEIDPDHEPTLARRAGVLLRLRRYRAAISDYERAAGLLEEGEEGRDQYLKNCDRLRGALKRGMHQVTAIRSTLHAAAGTHHKILADIGQGATVKVLENNEGWARVQIQDSNGNIHVGYVSTADLVLVLE
jgi:tetratricopeptide (TPR) repeat protein